MKHYLIYRTEKETQRFSKKLYYHKLQWNSYVTCLKLLCALT